MNKNWKQIGGAIAILFFIVSALIYSDKKTKFPSSQGVLPPSSTTSSSGNNATPTEPVAFWENLTPAIRGMIASTALGEFGYQKPPDVRIYAAADITGDGVPEALVYIDGLGSAHSPYITLLRIEDNQPVAALIKDQEGNIRSPMFMEGAGGSGRYGEVVELVSQESAIAAASFFAYGRETDSCGGAVYQWNPQTKVFEYNASLSTPYQQDFCRDKDWNHIRQEYGF